MLDMLDFYSMRFLVVIYCYNGPDSMNRIMQCHLYHVNGKDGTAHGTT